MKKNLFKVFGVSIIAFICGLLGAYAGADGTSKNWRRIAIPIIITLMAYVALKNPLVLILLGTYVAFTMGYGIPDTNDKGSRVGRFWHKLCVENFYSALIDRFWKIERLVNVLTRGTVGLVVCLFLICIPLIKNNWFTYIISSGGIIATYTSISWRDLGVYKFLGKQLLWSELYTYVFIGLFVTIAICY